MTALALAAVLGLAVFAFAITLAVREWLLDRALDRVVEGTEARYARLVANGEQLAGPGVGTADTRSDDLGATEVIPTEVVAALPRDRALVDLRGAHVQGGAR